MTRITLFIEFPDFDREAINVIRPEWADLYGLEITAREYRPSVYFLAVDLSTRRHFAVVPTLMARCERLHLPVSAGPSPLAMHTGEAMWRALALAQMRI